MTKAAKTKSKPADTKIRYDVLMVKQYEGNDGQERRQWRNIGVAFPHEDGQGFNVQCDAFPIDGKLVLRVHKAKDKADE